MFDKLGRISIENAGYTISGSNILDSSGNFVDSVEINGRTYHSSMGAEEYNQSQIQDKELKDTGFSYNPSSGATESYQKKVHLAKNKIADPKFINFNAEDPVNKEAVLSLFADRAVNDLEAAGLKANREDLLANESLLADYYINKSKEEKLIDTQDVNDEVVDFYTGEAAKENPENANGSKLLKPKAPLKEGDGSLLQDPRTKKEKALDTLDRAAKLETRKKELEETSTENWAEETRDKEYYDKWYEKVEGTDNAPDMIFSTLGSWMSSASKAVGDLLPEGKDKKEWDKINEELRLIKDPVAKNTLDKNLKQIEEIREKKNAYYQKESFDPKYVTGNKSSIEKDLVDRDMPLDSRYPEDTEISEELKALKTFVFGDKSHAGGITGDYYDLAIHKLEEENDRLTSWLDGDILFNPFGTIERNKEYSSLGALAFLQKATVDYKIGNKIKNKEPLTEGEKYYVKSLEQANQLNKLGLEQRGMYELVEGTAESFKFLVETALGSKMTFGLKGAAKKTTENLLNSVIKNRYKKVFGKVVDKAVLNNYAARFVGANAGLAGLTAMMPSTYSKALDRYVGEIETRIDPETGETVFLAGQDLYNTIKDETEIKITELEESLDVLEAKENPSETELKQIKDIKNDIKSYENSMRNVRPQSAIKSLWHGFSENYKENFSEQYTGKVFGKIGQTVTGRVGKRTMIGRGVDKVLNSKTAGAIRNSKVASIYNKVSDNSIRRYINEKTGLNLVGGIGEEIAEEILVQATPTYGKEGYSWDEYKEQVHELIELDFYKMVVGQTLLMSGAMGSVSSVRNKTLSGLANRKRDKRYNELASIGKDKRTKEQETEYQDLYKANKQKSNTENLFKALRDAGTTDKEMKKIFMKAGLGDFSMQQWDNEINKLKQLKTPEALAEAKELEENKFFNMAMAATRAGKGKDFHRSLKKARYNKNLSPETLMAMESVRKELSAAQNIWGEVEDMHSAQDIVTSIARQRYNERSEKEHKKEVSKLESNKEVVMGYENAIKKAFEVDNHLEVNLDNESNREKLNDYFNENNVDTEVRRFFTLKESLVAIQESKNLNTQNLKNLTSKKYQVQKELEANFSDEVKGAVNSKYGEDATVEDFNKELVEIHKKRHHKNTISKKKVEALKAEAKDHFEKKSFVEQLLKDQAASKKLKAEADKKAAETASKREVQKLKEESARIQQSFRDEADAAVADLSKDYGKQTQGTPSQSSSLNVEESPSTNSNLKKSQKVEEEEEIITSDANEETRDILDRLVKKQAKAEDKKNRGFFEGTGENNAVGQFDIDFDMPTEADPSIVKDIKDLADIEGDLEFEDVFQLVLSTLKRQGSKNPFFDAKSGFRGLARAYEEATGKDSNAEKIYNKYYNTRESIGESITAKMLSNTVKVETNRRELQAEPSASPTTQELEKVEEDTKKEMEQNSSASPITWDPKTRRPIMNLETESVTEENNEHTAVVGLVKGSSPVIENLGDTGLVKVSFPEPTGVPELDNSDSNINNRKIVTPGNLVTGETVGIKSVANDQNSWSNYTVRDSKGENVNFEDWVEANRGDKSIEEFMKTDAFIGKVPVVYTIGNEAVAYLHDTDYFTPITVDVPDQKKDAPRNIDNPTEGHQKVIDSAKRTNLQLRKDILSGKVSSMEVKENLANSLVKIPAKDAQGNPIPLKTLDTLEPNSSLMVIGKTLNTLHKVAGKKIKPEHIVNSGSVIGNLDEGVKNVGKTIYLSEVGKNSKGETLYQAHLAQFKQEDGLTNGLFKSDIETIKYAGMAHQIIKAEAEGKPLPHSNVMSLKQAEAIAIQVKSINPNIILKVFNSLDQMFKAIGVNYLRDTKNKKVFKNMNSTKETIEAAIGGKPFIRNASFSFKGKMPSITLSKDAQGKSQFKVEASKDSQGNETNYDGYLRSRYSTNVMSYNVGSETQPVHTSAVKRTLKFAPIYNEVSELEKETEKLEKKVEDNKEVSSKETVVQKDLKELKNESKESEKVTNTKLTETEEQAYEEALRDLDTFNLDLEEEDSQDDIPDMDADMFNESQEVSAHTVAQKGDVVDKLVSMLSDKDTGKEKAKQKFMTYLKARKDIMQAHISKLENILATVPSSKVSKLLITYQAAVNKVEVLEKDTDNLLEEAVRVADKASLGTKDIDQDAELGIEESNYSKSSNESTAVDKVGVKIKRIFAKISNGRTGYLGIERYDSFDNMYNTIIALMSTDVLKTPDYNSMMKKLKEYSDSYAWISPLIKELDNSPQDIKNLFVTNAYRQAVNAKVSMFQTNNKGGLTSTLFSSNANSTERMVRNYWEEGFNRSTVTIDDKLNKAALQRIAKEISEIKNMERGSEEKSLAAREWLENFGIELHDNTWKAITNGKLFTQSTGGVYTLTEFEDLFSGQDNKRSGNLFYSLEAYANNTIEEINKSKEDITVEPLSEFHPFTDMGSILKQLSILEAQHNPIYISSTRRVGGKSVSETEAMSYVYTQINKLKAAALNEDDTYLDELAALSFSKNSLILKLLQEDEGFANTFDHSFFDIMSLKDQKGDNPMFGGISQLSELDYMTATRIAFQDLKQGSVKSSHFGFSLRAGTMSTPTNSDKGKMMLLKTAVFNFFRESDVAFQIDKEGEVSFTEELKDLIWDQLIAPEATRALNYDGNTNIKNYNKGASRFNFMPILNTVTDGEGLTASNYFNSNTTDASLTPQQKKDQQEASLQVFRETFFDKMVKKVEESILVEAKENVNKTAALRDARVDKFNNDKYLEQNSSKDVEQKALLAELDFVINSKISTMNTFQLIGGDPAIYYKSDIKTAGLKGRELVEANNAISKELGINLGKRMALMIAPGAVLADSHKNDYIQLFLEDTKDMSGSIDYLISSHYGNKALSTKLEGDNTAKMLIEEHKISEDKGRKQLISSLLKDKFPKVKDYIGIESTDAQEYTTVKEHLYVLEKQGKVSEEVAKEIEDTLARGEVLTDELLGFVLQPLKPVYSGTIIEGDVNRVVYVKSSSFPLVPQLSQGTSLDKLRIRMENLEATRSELDGKKVTVRASYGTANKVGALTNAIDLNDLDNTDFEAEDSQGNKKYYLTLPRSNFKIQQENPFKSAKMQEDKVSMGTQITKLLFGNGAVDVVGFKFKGETIDGRKLQEKFTQYYGEMVNYHKGKLLKEVGLDNNLKTDDLEFTERQIQKLLIAEAESRGFSKNDIKSLGLEETNGVFHFKTPLFLSANSFKYEAMLNAIVSNRIFKQKMPGAGLIVGSENKLDWGSNLEAVKDKSRIVWTNGVKSLSGIKEVDTIEETLTNEQKTLISQGLTEVPNCI